MKTTRLIHSLAAAALAAPMVAGLGIAGVGCAPVQPPDDGGPGPDGGAPPDGGNNPPPDGGNNPPPDAGNNPPDAGNDAGPPPYDAGPLPPEEVTVQGVVKRRDYANLRAQANAQVIVVNYDADGNGSTANDIANFTVSADAQGNYTMPGLPPGSALVVETKYVGDTCTDLDANCTVPNGFRTRQIGKTYAEATQTIDPYVVKYQWLIDQGIRCGVYADYAAAKAADGVDVRTAIIGQFKNEQGQPLANVPKTGFKVTVAGYDNTNPDYLCFLEKYDPGTPNDPADDYYRVPETPVNVSTDTGLFIAFKNRNDGNQTGAGEHVVYAPNFTEARLSLQAGMVGIVTLTSGVVPEPPPDLVDFETEIMPIFANNACTACHQPGGPGYVGAEGAPDQYYLDFTAAPDVVHAAITAAVAERVNYDDPSASLLVQKPLLEDPPNHPNASFESLQNPDAALLVAWIAQGAPRYAVPPVPPPVVSTLTDVMNSAKQIGCVACHYGDRGGGPYGGLSLDGCIPNYAYPAEYAPTNGALPVAEQPAVENQRCVYYHLKYQAVADDPYYAEHNADFDGNGTPGEQTDGRRVNTVNVDHSMLLRNPYCGPDADNNGTGDGCNADVAYPEAHPVRLFTDKAAAPYTYFSTWIGNGAPNDGQYGAQ